MMQQHLRLHFTLNFIIAMIECTDHLSLDDVATFKIAFHLRLHFILNCIIAMIKCTDHLSLDDATTFQISFHQVLQ